jgi:LysM repeat protein
LDTEIPVSEIKAHKIVSVPFVHKGSRTFSDENTVALKTLDQSSHIYYTLDNSEPDTAATLYTQPLTIQQNTTLKAIARKNGVNSKTIEAYFTKTPKGRSIELFTDYGSEYSAGGDGALIDHLKGPNSYMTGRWQGYEGVNLDAVLDLGKLTKLNQLSTGFLQDWNAWIFMPEWVDYYVSSDGEKFIKLGRVVNKVDEKEAEVVLQDYVLQTNTKARYVKVMAKNRTFNPDWHRAPGDTCWIFADEISIQ